jgi:hypothetical protein
MIVSSKSREVTLQHISCVLVTAASPETTGWNIACLISGNYSSLELPAFIIQNIF